MDYTQYSLPIIGALIGWGTNAIAVKMLFHPHRPIRLPFYTLQGVFPKRQAQVAHKVGEIVSTELFSAQEVKSRLIEKAKSPEVVQLVEARIRQVLSEKLATAMPMLVAMVPPALLENVAARLSDEISKVVDSVVSQLSTEIDAALDVHKVVEEKVANFSIPKLEEILYAIMRREFRFIELSGAGLGFLIGVIQVAAELIL